MLRAVAILLLLANLGYFAWTQGSLAGLGLAPNDERETERLSTQIQPDTLRLIPAERADSKGPTPSPVAAAESPGSCWQVTGLSLDQASNLVGALRDMGLDENQWSFTETRSAARWLVYMGPYNGEQLARKKGELRQLKVEFREANPPSMGNGLVLGTFPSDVSAQQALKDLAKKGVRTARAELERPEVLTMTLRLPAITEAQRARLNDSGGALGGNSLVTCNEG
jgi:hypothetical protein